MNDYMDYAYADETEAISEAETMAMPEEGGAGCRSVVQVMFPECGVPLAYYNDSFDLRSGDIVFVEGKYEGKAGRVVRVNRKFRIKLSDYKRVIGKADTEVHGELHTAGSHLVTFDRSVLPYAKVVTWYKAPENEDEYVSGNDEDEGEGFDILTPGPIPFSDEIIDRGLDYYKDDKVVYVELDGERCRAIVVGKRPYTVEFSYRDGRVFGMTCECWCAFNCKHEFAAILQLRELLEKLEHSYEAHFDGYFAAVAKTEFFSKVIDRLDTGTLRLD